MGIVVTAPTLEGLFEVAALALTQIVTNVDTLTQRVVRQFSIQEDEVGILLVSWLQELLYLLDTEGLVFGRSRVNIRGVRLEATAWGEPLDRENHTLKTEIKAVTYHQLEVVRSDQGWQARVIFDI